MRTSEDPDYCAPCRSSSPQAVCWIILGLVAMGCVMWFTRIGKENLAEMAQMDLRETKPMPLSGTLTQLIESNREKLVATQAHPLLGKPAPDFTLKDADGNDVRLSEKLKKGPVVLVFYLGYWCDHCVSQLFGLNEDYNYFRETGAEVLAVSSDPIQLTQERYAEYGRFKFPVLTDPDHLIAQKFGVYAPAGEGRKEWEIHGTYVINSQGIIIWAQTGKKPFTGNPTLLTELAGLSSSLPAPLKTGVERNSVSVASRTDLTEMAGALIRANQGISREPPTGGLVLPDSDLKKTAHIETGDDDSENYGDQRCINRGHK